MKENKISNRLPVFVKECSILRGIEMMKLQMINSLSLEKCNVENRCIEVDKLENENFEC